MAAPSGTVWGSIVNGSSSGRKGRLGIYVKVSNTATQTTVNLQVWFWTIYSCSDSNNTPYFSYGPNVTSATTEYSSRTIKHTVSSGSGWSTSNQTKLMEHEDTYTRGTSSVTHKAYAKFEGIDILNGAVYANTSYTIPALASYTVSYNANGGSGAPSSQTKWYGKSLTLSSTKPTRTGYSFQGWATSASGSVAYSAGGSYTSNSAVTLYAVWKANTYTVSYNANGGSGAPSSQTKIYGKTLTLSSTKPTRANYTFKGWGTSASATTVAYSAGGSYTANAAITLYAIWTLNYTKPRINSLSITRCTSGGTADDSGTYAKVVFSWVCDKTASSIKIEWKLSSTTTWSSATVSASGTSGSVSQIVGAGAISADNTYDIRVTVADSGGNSSQTRSLVGTKFTMDLLSGGNGIAFGKPAELSGYADVGFKARFRDNVVLEHNKSLYSKSSDGDDIHLINLNSNNNTVIAYGGYNKGIGATNLYGHVVNIQSNGNVNVKSPLHLEVTTDASGTANNNPALTIGPTSGTHLEFDGNEIMSKSSGTATGSLYINAEGGNVCLNDNGVGSTYVRGCRIAENKVLWSGGYYMSDTQTANLSESISKQANGIILVWSYYEDGASADYNWNTQFIPKYLVSAHNGKGVSIFLTTATGNTVASKYVYISDSSITGYSGNNAASYTTTSGIQMTPKGFVLRYVIGV